MKFIKSKEFGYALLILLLIILAGVLLFFPDLIENKYPYSYQALATKKQQVETNNSTLYQNEGRISSSIDSLEDIKSKEVISEAQALEVRKGIKESDFELKVSSILISLEQRAYENNVDLNIAYSLIKHTSGSGEINDYEAPIETPNEEAPVDGTVETPTEEVKDKDVVVEVKPTEEVKDENVKDDKTEPIFSEDRINAGAVYIEGIDVAVIPIVVEGSYYNLRNYIKYLDQIGMIEPSSITLTSNEKIVTATIILNVFHGEVDL